MNSGLYRDRIVAGDRQAFAELVGRYQGPLFGFLGRMGLSQTQAEEIAQETFLRVWLNLADYRPERAAFATWLFAIARNLALGQLARAAGHREVNYGDEIPAVACDRPSAIDALALRQRHRGLQEALRALPSADRSLLALAYVEELSHADIARIEGCKTGAIKTRVHRAKEKLRRLMETLQ